MQKIPIKKYAYRLLVFSTVIAAISIIVQYLFGKTGWITPALPFIVLFFFLITSFTLFIVLRGDIGKEGTRFISGYLLSRLIKFFSCLLFLFIYVIVNKTDRWPFAIAFIVIYFIYSIYEVIILKKENDKKQEVPGPASPK